MAAVLLCHRDGIQEADLEASARAQICLGKQNWCYYDMWTIDERQRRSANVKLRLKSNERRDQITFPGTNLPSINAPSGPVLRGSVAGMDG